MVGEIVSVPKPLTAKQFETLQAYRARVKGDGKPLTEKQTKDWHSLENKLNESKVFKLNDTAKKRLNKLVFEEKHNRKSKLDVKYFEKGLEKEKESRDLLSNVLNVMLPADDERRSNEWVTGKRDIKNDGIAIDIKTSWNYESYNNHLLEKPNEVYLRQIDSYMDLWDIKDGLLCHVLVDTPYSMIEDELRRLDWKYNIMGNDGYIRDESIEKVVEVVESHIYTEKGLDGFCENSAIIQKDWFKNFIELDKSERIHMIPHAFEKERIEQRNECITLAREYMKTVKPINNIITDINRARQDGE